MFKNAIMKLAVSAASLIGTPHLPAAAVKAVRANLGSRLWLHSLYMRYSDSGLWVFDVPFAGLVDEPFVAGVDEIIEFHLRKAKKLTIAKQQGIPVLFTNTTGIPDCFKGGTNVTLHRIGNANGGATYEDKVSKKVGWLCPNLSLFFAEPPDHIQVSFRM